MYIIEGKFACRRCCGLCYLSQLAGPAERARIRARKIMAKINPSHTSLLTVPRRRPGQWRRTYLRLLKRLERLIRLDTEDVRKILTTMKREGGDVPT